MSHDPQDFEVPVIFDVTAHSREEAGAAVVAILSGHQLVGNVAPSGAEPRPVLDSWWTVEQVDKFHDGNDRDAGVVLFEDDVDYLHGMLRNALLMMRRTAPVDDRLERLVAYFAREARVLTPDDRDADGY